MRKITINGIEFAASAIRQADWQTERSRLSVYVGHDYNGEQKIRYNDDDSGKILWTATPFAADVEDEEPWEAAWAYVTALDGREFTLYYEVNYVCNARRLIEGREEYPGNDSGDNISEITDEDDWEMTDLSDVCDTMPRISVDNGTPDYADYEAAAEDYVNALPQSAKAWVDRDRGFANEWCFYIDKTGEIEPCENWGSVDRERWAGYIADAICSEAEYNTQYAAERYVGAYEIGAE